MSNLAPNLPPGVFANKPVWRFEKLTADEGKTFGYGPGVRHRKYGEVEGTYNPGALVHGWWSWWFAWHWGKRAWILYRWCEKIAGS